ncbi:hypothetical protein LJB81_01250 [Desulfovibrio sp. OttesenSCG-928-M14]|nr:hypothetical protein [Desulfovibrio sp. OttesenSCG-928-M14]
MSEETTHQNFSRLTRDEKRDFLIKAMSDLGTEPMTEILLALPLRDIPSSLKARIVFRLGITAVGHSYWLQSTGTQVWEFPQVPPALRPLITAVSRLVGEFEAAITSAVNGRGDYAKVVVLLNPERIEQLGQEIRTTVLGYAAELRSASGRNRKPPRPRAQGDGKDALPEEQAAVARAEGEGAATVQDDAAGPGMVEGESPAVPVADAAETAVTEPSSESEIEPMDAGKSDTGDEPSVKTKRKRAVKADDAELVDDTDSGTAPEEASTDTREEAPADSSAFSGLFDSLLKTDES